MIDTSLIKYIRKPNAFDTYENPIDNLIHAILIQAISDSRGYIDDQHKHRTGDEVVQYLETDGRQLFSYLLTRPRAAVSIMAHKGRKERYNREVKKHDNK